MNVSVLLPVYNAGPPLGAAIESILAQELRDFELLVIDDASTDRSAETIRRYAQRDDRIRAVYHDRNVGLSGTLNEGLETARGELVARMDQDDESLPPRLRIQSRYMKEHPRVAVAGSWVYHMGATRAHDRLVPFPTEAEVIRRTLPEYNCMYHPTIVMRRREILALGGYRPEFKNAEDYDLWLRVSEVHDLGNVPEPLLRYRFSVGGMTIGRKWEQLYHVYLAQAAHEPDVESIEEARDLAAERLAETDRTRFLRAAARATIDELVRLGLWRDALAVVRTLARDADLGTAGRLVAQILRVRGRAAAGRAARAL